MSKVEEEAEKYSEQYFSHYQAETREVFIEGARWVLEQAAKINTGHTEDQWFYDELTRLFEDPIQIDVDVKDGVVKAAVKE